VKDFWKTDSKAPKEDLAMAKVIIVNAFPVLRKGVKDILSENENVSVVLESVEESEVRRTILKEKVDLVVMDLEIPGNDGLGMLRMIKTTDPAVPVLVLTALPEELYGVAAFKHGADAYLSNESGTEELILAVQKLMGGRRYITPHLAERLAEFVENGGQNLPHERLTKREFQVMLMLGRGMSINDISEELCLSYWTVATYKRRTLTKMGLDSVAQLMRYVLTEGMMK
jgi:DNA-binding NarL/FixJ family response regulator